MKVALYTLGCRLNQAESESLADRFSKAGYEVTGPEDAELVIVNTCTVTSKAEQKARRMIRLFAQSSEVIVTGCYAELGRPELEAVSPAVTVFSLKEKAGLLDLPQHITRKLEEGLTLGEAVKCFHGRTYDAFAFDASSFQYHSRAYLKIQDGCDNHCGFCRTSVVRGKSVFLSHQEVIRRALALEKAGLHEIMLTGVNLSNYDHAGGGLGGLLKELLAALGPGMRLRLSSMESDNVDDTLLETLKDKRMQPHFHIPVQSASEKVLKRVGRFDSIDHIRYMIGKMREYKDDPFIACDIITGLPGETDEEFQVTYDFLSSLDFSAMHVFPFSPRPGTALYKAKDKVPERIRDERAEVLRKLSRENSRRYAERQLGKSVEVLSEENGTGTTGNYLKARLSLPEGRTPVEGMLYTGTVTSIDPVTVTVSKL